MRFDLAMYDGVLDDVEGGLRPDEGMFILKKEDGLAELVYCSGDEDVEAYARFVVDPHYPTFLAQLRAAVASMVTACRATGLREGETFVSGAKS